MIKFFVVLFLIIPITSLASITDHSERFALGLVSKVDTVQLSMKSQDNENQDVLFEPNAKNAVGVQVSAFGYTVTYTQKVDNGDQPETIFGRSDYTDYRLGTYIGKDDRFFLNGYYNKYEGFYVKNSSEVDASINSNVQQILNPNLKISSFGGAILFVNDPSNYSPAAAFSHSAQQKNSGGSWLVRASLDFVTITDTQEIIPTQVRSNYGVDQTFNEAKFGSYSLAGGYGHTFTKNNFFFTGQVLAGAGYQLGKYNGTAFNEKSLTAFNGKWNIWLGTGYNGDDNFFVANFLMDGTEFKTDSINATTSLLTGSIVYGHRF